MVLKMSKAQQQRNSNVESCGFMIYFLSNVFAILYAIWAFLPDSIVQQIDEQYGAYYPPRELAIYIPIYLVLLFFCIPIMYMGLNMLSAPKVDDVSNIWDTRSNECAEPSPEGIRKDVNSNGCVSGCDCTRCEGDAVNGGNEHSVPSICDLDVRLVNRIIYQQMKKSD